jgi:hypothetical protein
MSYKSRKFAFEPLEDRRLMAVSTVMKGGNLYITGDNANETVVISAGPRPGEVNVNGLIYPGFTKDSDIKIDLYGGNDKVTINNLTFDDLTVNMGNGNDDVNINGVETNGPTDINMGGGFYTDTVWIGNSNFRGGKTDIYLGAGNDWLIVSNLKVGAPTYINAGGGNDYVSIYNSRFYSIDAQLGHGWDTLHFTKCNVTNGATFDAGICPDTVNLTDSNFYSTLTVYGGDDSDNLKLTNSWVAGDATIDAGGGNTYDYVCIDNTDFLSTLKVNLGAGNDIMDFKNGSTAKQANINAGDGYDLVKIVDAVFTNLDVALGAHNDSLEIARSRVYGTTKFDGGSGGIDSFYYGLGNKLYGYSYSDKNFERRYSW